MYLCRAGAKAQREGAHHRRKIGAGDTAAQTLFLPHGAAKNFSRRGFYERFSEHGFFCTGQRTRCMRLNPRIFSRRVRPLLSWVCRRSQTSFMRGRSKPETLTSM
jgi:hypothetical protein